MSGCLRYLLCLIRPQHGIVKGLSTGELVHSMGLETLAPAAETRQSLGHECWGHRRDKDSMASCGEQSREGGACTRGSGEATFL